MAIISSQAGQVLQVQMNRTHNGLFTAISTTNWNDCFGIYVDIKPIHSNSILIWQTAWTFNVNDEDGYARFRIVDSKNSDTQWSNNTHMGSYGYYNPTSVWSDGPLLHGNTAGTTNQMRLQLQARVNSGGNLRGDWSSSDDRLVMVTEVAQ